jgi:ribosome-binding factor A
VSRRIEKVASTVRSVISEAIQRRLSDPRISPFTSVTRVAISRDLEFATVYVSVMGTDAEQRRTIAGLQHARGHVQSLLARELRIRQCPQVRFLLDDSIKKATETIRMLDQAMHEGRDLDSPADPAAAEQDISAETGGDE